MSSEVALYEIPKISFCCRSRNIRHQHQPSTYRTQSSVPVPDVYLYDLEPDDAGAPYIVMEYIPGSVASELQQQIETPPGQFGTPKQDEKFRRQVAAIQVELEPLSFDKIGSLHQDPETQDFYIGPDCQIGQGPWTPLLNTITTSPTRRWKPVFGVPHSE